MPEPEQQFVIVGNGVAGTTAAETLRKNNPHCRIYLIAEEPYPLYNRVALPPFLKARVNEQKVLMRTPEWHEQLGITLQLETRVERIDQVGKAVLTSRGETIPYDKLLVATGGRSNHLRAPGAETGNVFYFQTLDDSKAIIAAIERDGAAVTTGGSFIAYELTEAFRARGLQTIWLIRGPRFLRRILDEEGGALVDHLAARQGVEVLHQQEIAAVESKDGVVSRVLTTGGRSLACDVLGCGLGLTMNVECLAGTTVEVRKGIVTNERMVTNDPNIYAAGDIAEFKDVIAGCSNMMGTWHNAIGHGKTAGLNMLYGKETYAEIPAYTSTMFESSLTVMGLTPEIHPGVAMVSRTDWTTLTYRGLFFLDGRLVGGALIGERRAKARFMELIKSREQIENRESLLAL